MYVYMMVVGWYIQQLSSSCTEEAYFICLVYTMFPFGISVSTLKPHNRAPHNTAPLRLTSLYNVPSVETEEGFTQSRPVAVVLLKTSTLWLVFPWTIRHFHPAAFSLSFSLASQDERDVLWMRLPACQSRFNSWQMQGFLIIYCTWFSILPQEGLKKARELGGGWGVLKWKWMTRSVSTGVGGEVSGEEKAGRGEEATGGLGTRREMTWRGGSGRKVLNISSKRKNNSSDFSLLLFFVFLRFFVSWHNNNAYVLP